MHPQKLLNFSQTKKENQTIANIQMFVTHFAWERRRPPKEELLWSICTEEQVCHSWIYSSVLHCHSVQDFLSQSTQAWREELQQTEKEIMRQTVKCPKYVNKAPFCQYTFNIEVQLSRQAWSSRNDDVAVIAPRVRLLCVIDVDGQIGRGHRHGKTHPPPKVSATDANLS